MNKPYCKKDVHYIPNELWKLWKELFGKIEAFHTGGYAIYYYISEELWYKQNNSPPKNSDILCIIEYNNNSAKYFYRFKYFETIKDYICALKNIAFI